MISNEEIDKFLAETEDKIKEIDQRFEATKAMVDEVAKTIGPISDEERQEAKRLIEKIQREHEIESVNHKYALEQQQFAASSPATTYYSRRRHMV